MTEVAEEGDQTPSNDAAPSPNASKLSRLRTRLGEFGNHEVSYKSCAALFLCVAMCVAMIPFKEYYLGSYVTKPFDEVRYDVVARKLSNLGVVTSGVHYFDTFDRTDLPIIDSKTGVHFDRDSTKNLSFTDFLARANVRRATLLTVLPSNVLALPVNTMVDMHAPLCGLPSSNWEAPAQQLFGNWFPVIRHEFCRDFYAKFPRARYFNQSIAPIDTNLVDVGKVTLGLIAVVNMSEVYLRQFTDSLVIRKIMRNVQEGFLDLEIPEYTDAVADTIVKQYKNGITLSNVVKLLPASIDSDHVALVDVLGISAILQYYLDPQQLTMGVNVNSESAILAEVTHASASYVTSDFLINAVGMHYVSTVHLAPYWACALQHTTMAKGITVADVDGAAVKQCGIDLVDTLPVFIVNLMYLFQSKQRDYTKIDNTTTFSLGRRRESNADYVSLSIPETFEGSNLLSMDGSAWTKENSNPYSQSTPYGYLFTPDCRGQVDKALQQSGRNLQKYQAYIGDGLGECDFRDSQETTPQTLCRLFMTADEVQFRSLDGTLSSLPSCASLLTEGASVDTRALEQESLRQIEWFMIDTTFVQRRLQIQDNTSRQIRTFLLLLNLLGAIFYSSHYILILRNVWAFISNSVYRPAKMLSRYGSASAQKYSADPPARLKIVELLQCDPADGALAHPGTMALLYLGAVGALSNIFSLKCTAELSNVDGNVVVYCEPSIPLSSLTLAFTSLSSSYWIIRVSLQTRSLRTRLAHAARSDLARFWLLNFTTVLVIHFSCKGLGDLIFRNTELRFDPHLYAIFGSFVVTLIMSSGSVFIQAAALAAVRGPRRRGLGFLLHRTGPAPWRQEMARVISDRKFTAKWSSNELDSVLNHCTTPLIARQLELSRRRRVWNQSHSHLILDTNVADKDTSIHINEFVSLHCAAGAHSHLRWVRWGADGSVNFVDGPRSSPRVHCEERPEKPAVMSFHFQTSKRRESL